MKPIPQSADKRGMDRRLFERYFSNLEVTVIDVSAQDRVVSGRIVDISETGMCADLSLGLTVGTVVKVQMGDCVLFGHVTYCTEGKSFRTGLDVVPVLLGSSKLSQLFHSPLRTLDDPTLPT